MDNKDTTPSNSRALEENESGKEKQPEPNQLHRALLSVLSLSPFKAHNSASRDQMFSSHIGQAIVINGATERNIQTGMEREYGKYTFNVKMPCDADIIRVIERYPSALDTSSIIHNPETLVIYEDAATKQVGCLSLTDYFSHHSYFGFPYKRKAAVRKLRAGESIAKGTVLMDSPSVNDNGGYMPGAECNVAFMSHPGTSEDGIVISRDVLPRFGFKTYERRVVEWGSKAYPVNLYGDEHNYKPHPDIGDLVRADGALVSLRSYDENFAPVEQSMSATRQLESTFDTTTYAAPYGRVIDIKVWHDPESTPASTPIGMDRQTEKYDLARRRWYQQILDEYKRLQKARGKTLSTTWEFHRLVVEAISVVGPGTPNVQKVNNESAASDKVTKLYRGNPLDDYRVEFVIEVDVIPTVGFKLTDTVGGRH